MGLRTTILPILICIAILELPVFIASLVVTTDDWNPEECENRVDIFNVVVVSVQMGLLLICALVTALSGEAGAVCCYVSLGLYALWNIGATIWGSIELWTGNEECWKESSVGKMTMAILIIKYITFASA